MTEYGNKHWKYVRINGNKSGIRTNKPNGHGMDGRRMSNGTEDAHTDVSLQAHRDISLYTGTQEQVEVSKYYLEYRLIDHTLQVHMLIPTYINPPQESRSIKISDFVQVLVGDWIGKSGVVQWALNVLIWFQDEMELLMNDTSSHIALPFIQVEAVIVECTHLPAILKFTKECIYDVRPGDVVSVAHGPEFHTEGVTHNIDLDAFKKYMKKDVFVIGGQKKGFWAMLYDLSTDTYIIAVHSQSCITVRYSDIATN
ncbi:uncharacterized protein F5891DRAFT_987882 [Suillus fuscotomentosus]|uniref:Uncharacterized protein n=1 Tax=Suillus fuscotomentosus TaxID=1912939 RepID=A0AAD4HCH7_9AGAM|nr:uncharacterized protein F5891DRAFT_987882 [Suillus fuscotomentosus]KAG1888022.1 hypothetical protein F5891DRAFT_987882 [Suillus fuscotomentosus]